MYDLTILHRASLKAVGQAKENSEKNQAVAEEMVPRQRRCRFWICLQVHRHEIAAGVDGWDLHRALGGSSAYRPRGIRSHDTGFLSKEFNMKTRWALLSAAIFFGFLSNQVIAAEGVLGQGNISCDSWIKTRGDGNPVAATRTAWVLGFVTAFNQYRSKPEGDVSGGKDTEVLMLRIDDHCRLYPLDNLYNASSALVDELRQWIRNRFG
jgi:hypothetical protein